MVKLLQIFFFILFMQTAYAQQFAQWPSEEGLYLEFYKGNSMVGSASGFVFKSPTQNYLITNYHKVANKLWVQRKPIYTKDNLLNGYWTSGAATIKPDKVAIYHNSRDGIKRIVKYENLIGPNGKALWHSFALKNGFVDVVALPLKDTTDVLIYPVEVANSMDYNGKYPLGLLVYPEDSKPGVTDIKRDKNKIYLSDKTYDALSGSPVYCLINNEPKFLGVFTHSPSLKSNIVRGAFIEKKFALLP